MTVVGIHTNAQNKPLADLIEVWRHADGLGYGWISISDHFPGGVGPSSNEAVVSHAAMASVTERATCGVLCYSVGFRHPAVLASVAVTIDHLSGGRAAIGLGSGSAPQDYEIYGFPYPSAKERTDVLEEATRCITRLLRDDVVDIAGDHFHITQARHEPRPVQDRLPVWLGVAGPRGIRIAAAHADGWNAAFVTPEVFAEKREQLHAACADLGRSASEVATSVNLILMLDVDPAGLPEERRVAALAGSVEQVVDRIGAYGDAGADGVNLFLPHPWNLDGLERLASPLGLPAR